MSDDLSKLNLVELLDLLEPLPEPARPSLWPQTVGWLWLGLLVAAVVVWLGLRWRRRRRANAYRRAALAAIATAGGDPVALADILRRTALAGYSRREVAALHGDEWLAFLDNAYCATGFRDGPGKDLATAPYRPMPAGPDTRALVADWVRKHRQLGARA